MMEEPGSFSGMLISPSPSRGPDASQRMSFAIFIRLAASAFSAPCANTSSSLEESSWNLFSASVKLPPVRMLIWFAVSLPNPSGALSPVPTAVPPMASWLSPVMASAIWTLFLSSILRQPEISCENAMGTASCKCVLPLLITPSFSFSNRLKVSISLSIAGRRRCVMARTAATCIAVGKVSLELWLLLISSLGCSNFLPQSSFPLLAITSFAFILDCVPLPVCQTTSGKLSLSFPSITSSQARQMYFIFSSDKFPILKLAIAAAFFNMPKAWMISPGIVSVPILKFSKLLSVCAPQYLSAGTFISPIVSFSMRYSI